MSKILLFLYGILFEVLRIFAGAGLLWFAFEKLIAPRHTYLDITKPDFLAGYVILSIVKELMALSSLPVSQDTNSKLFEMFINVGTFGIIWAGIHFFSQFL